MFLKKIRKIFRKKIEKRPNATKKNLFGHFDVRQSSVLVNIASYWGVYFELLYHWMSNSYYLPFLSTH